MIQYFSQHTDFFFSRNPFVRMLVKMCLFDTDVSISKHGFKTGIYQQQFYRREFVEVIF